MRQRDCEDKESVWLWGHGTGDGKKTEKSASNSSTPIVKDYDWEKSSMDSDFEPKYTQETGGRGDCRYGRGRPLPKAPCLLSHWSCILGTMKTGEIWCWRTCRQLVWCSARRQGETRPWQSALRRYPYIHKTYSKFLLNITHKSIQSLSQTLKENSGMCLLFFPFLLFLFFFF